MKTKIIFWAMIIGIIVASCGSTKNIVAEQKNTPPMMYTLGMDTVMIMYTMNGDTMYMDSVIYHLVPRETNPWEIISLKKCCNFLRHFLLLSQ